MNLNSINTKREYEELLEWIDKKFDKQPKTSSTEGQQLQAVLLLVKDFEDEHYPISTPESIS